MGHHSAMAAASPIGSSVTFREVAPPFVPVLDPPPARKLSVRIHKVQSGETLIGISRRYGLKLETIRWANAMEPEEILAVGRELIIPPMDGVMHLASGSETLRQIANRYGVKASAIAEANSIADVDQPVGLVGIVVPGAKLVGQVGVKQSREGQALVASVEDELTLSVAQVSEPEPIEAMAGASDSARVAVSGEVSIGIRLSPTSAASAIAQVPVPEAAKTAPVGDIQPGSSKPKVPPKPIEYRVASGDTVSAIAEKFNVNPETVVANNDLQDSDRISVGQKLTILPVSGIMYTVQPGDTLSDIAAKFKIDLGPIIDFNGLGDSDVIRVGQKLILPGAKPLPNQGPQPPVTRAAVQVPPAPPRAATAPAAARAPAAAPAPAPGPSALGGSVADVARRYNGYKYRWGGSSPATGFDCSGFVWYVLKESGKPISRGLWGQYNSGPHVSQSQLQPGDIVFFQNTYMPGLSHNGIYIGGGQFINAVDERSGVKISSIWDPYWSSRWFGATRP